MDPIQKRELKRQAWMRLAAQRRRAGLLRGRVVAISLICFALLWGIVFAQMATGNDPVLAGKRKATAAGVANTKREVETTDPRELRLEREAAQAREIEEEAVEVEPEFEEFEEEPLVTSQS
jgi:non-ribosomal peptide synthetase component E (peptide arylation enzyme)